MASVADRTVTPGRGNKPPFIDDEVIGSYVYNGLGQRVSKTLTAGTVTQNRYGTDGALLSELDGSGAVQREYIYLNGQLLAVLDQEESGGSGGGRAVGRVGRGRLAVPWLLQKGKGQRKPVAEGRERPAGGRSAGIQG